MVERASLRRPTVLSALAMVTSMCLDQDVSLETVTPSSVMEPVGFINALGVLFPVFMDSFQETRERTGQFECLSDVFISLSMFTFYLRTAHFLVYFNIPEKKSYDNGERQNKNNNDYRDHIMRFAGRLLLFHKIFLIRIYQESNLLNFKFKPEAEAKHNDRKTNRLTNRLTNRQTD